LRTGSIGGDVNCRTPDQVSDALSVEIFGQNWIAGAEVLYVNLGSSDFNFNNGARNTIHEKLKCEVPVPYITG
jgi:hypothetical protein